MVSACAFGAADNKHEVIGIPTVRHSGLPLPVFLTAVLRPRWILLFQLPAVAFGLSRSGSVYADADRTHSA